MKQVDGRGGTLERGDKKLRKAIGIEIFSRFEKNRVCDGKDRRIGTDAQREWSKGGSSEVGLLVTM